MEMKNVMPLKKGTCSAKYEVPSSSEEKRHLFELVVSKMDAKEEESAQLRKMFEEYIAVADMTNSHVWKPINSDLPERLHAKNAVLTGDAAHPLLPFTSQGTSMALEDSIVLADLLGNAKNSSGSRMLLQSLLGSVHRLPRGSSRGGARYLMDS